MTKSYKIECKVCGRVAFYVTPHNGMGYCFVCSYTERDTGKGYIPPVKERSKYITDIRHYYEKMTNYYHSSLDTQALKFLYNRGFNDTTIASLKIGYCPPGKSSLYEGLIPREAGLVYNESESWLAGRITFPYFAKNSVTDIRGRSILKDILPYKSPYNSPYYRGADYPYNYHLHDSDYVILTEGEIKADLAVQYDFPTEALPGINGWRKGFVQRDGQKIILCFDSQVDNRYVRKAIIHAAAQIHKPYVATLPLMGKQKQDIDNFILCYGPELFGAVINAALPFNTWLQLQR